MWPFSNSNGSLVDFLKDEAVDIAAVAVGKYALSYVASKFIRDSMGRTVAQSLIDTSAVASLIFLTTGSNSVKDFVPLSNPLG